MATKVCDFKLAADMVANCEQSSVAGIKAEGYIINFDDIDFESCVRDKDNPNVYSTIVLHPGKNAYKMYVPGKTPYTGTNIALVTGTYRNKFTKQISVVILDNGPEVCHNVVDQLANGTFVAILENKFRGADLKNTFEVYGMEQGLTATELADDKYSEDSDGGWKATLEETNAPTSGVYLFNNTISATRAALESLVTGAA